MISWIALAIMTRPEVGDIQEVLQKNLQDASFTNRVIKGDQTQLAKISRDFGQSYKFGSTRVKLKEPFMLRVDTNVDDTELTMILNGTTKVIRVPRARLVQRENLADSPGKRQTVFDFGILTPSLFKGLYVAKFVRVDRASSDWVFDVTYEKRFDDTSRSRIWVDATKKYITKREWFNQNGDQMATFIYENPKVVDGVTIPTRLTVKNVDNVVAGITQYEGLKVNTGLADSLFKP